MSTLTRTAIGRTPMRSSGAGSGRARYGGTGDPAEPLGDVLIWVARRGGRRIRGLYLRVDLGAVHLDAARSFDAEPDGVTANVQYDDAHVVPDDDALPRTAGQNQHCGLPPWTP
jgi:hypothetical protein